MGIRHSVTEGCLPLRLASPDGCISPRISSPRRRNGVSTSGRLLPFRFWNWHKATVRAETAEAASAKRETPRVFAEDPDSLIAHLSDPKLLTRMQVVAYLEKWIVLTGTVEGAGGADLVVAPRRGSHVSLHFPAEGQLSDVRAGQTLTAVCQIKTVLCAALGFIAKLRTCSYWVAKVATLPKAS